ncbi:MAG: RNA methyltransferase [Candidatus Riflebacteria bacterium]|nr:RNA methyltransferase [Candidatus Riflebacteria bacterium]
MKTLESKNNPIIKRALKIVSRTNSEDLLLVEGQKLIAEAITSGAEAQMVFAETLQAISFSPELAKICFLVPRAIIRELSSVQTPAPVLAFFSLPSQPSLGEKIKNSDLLVVLDRIQDPGNLGTIIRTSEAMGASVLILLKGCCSRYNPKVARAAMGSSFRLPTFDNISPANLFKILKDADFATICADMHGTDLQKLSFPARSAIFFGQEGQGLSQEILKECTSRLAIPMQGQVESLNVATSVAICLYEWSRNRF